MIFTNVNESFNPEDIMTEGWGTAFAKLAVLVGAAYGIGRTIAATPGLGDSAIGSGIAVVGSGAALGAGIEKGFNTISRKAAEKILSDPKMQKYIISQCNIIYKSLSRQKGIKYSTEVSDDFGDTDLKRAHIIQNDSSVFRNLKNGVGRLKIGKYTIAAEGDITHVESVSLVLTEMVKGTQPRIKLYPIKPPTNDDLKKMGFRTEE